MLETLSYLADYYGTDKGSKGHFYTPIYEKWLTNRKIENLLEVGYGKGASIRMWRDYFPLAKIYCIEYAKDEYETKWNRPPLGISNVDIILGSSTSIHTWINVPFDLDVIIDDGSHFPTDQILTFIMGFGKLRSGGLYFIEDTFCGFTEKFGKTDELYKWLLGLMIDQQLPSKDAPGDYYASRHLLKESVKDIYAIHSYKSMIVIEKG